MIDDLEELYAPHAATPVLPGRRRSQGDRALAEDAVQEAFAKAVRKRSSYRDPPFPENPEL
jgi:DNA-directed RNA polymerase specialized sigma24 family protein